MEGLDNFHDYQVLEYALSFVIPYKDVNPLAHELINKFGSLGGVLEADEEDLMSVEGIGEVTAHFLTSILKIYHFYEKEKAKQITVLSSPQLTVNFVKSFLKGKLLEELYVVCLTPKSKVVKVVSCRLLDTTSISAGLLTTKMLSSSKIISKLKVLYKNSSLIKTVISSPSYIVQFSLVFTLLILISFFRKAL